MKRKHLVLCLLALSTLALGGCEFFDMMLEEEGFQVRAVGQEWVDAKGLNPLSEDGSVDGTAAAQVVKRALTGSTGDAEADAGLNSDQTLKRIKEADEFAELARESSDPAYLDQAIQLRPDDWTYRLQRGALELQVNQWPKYDVVEQDFQRAQALLGPGKAERIQYAEQGIKEMEKVKSWRSQKLSVEPQASLFADARLCRNVFTQLYHYYSVLASATGNEEHRLMAQQNLRDLGACPQP